VKKDKQGQPEAGVDPFNGFSKRTSNGTDLNNRSAGTKPTSASHRQEKPSKVENLKESCSIL